METFLRKIKPLEQRAREIEAEEIRAGHTGSGHITAKQLPLLRPAHAEAVKLILRTLKRQNHGNTDIQAARKFMETTGYDEHGAPKTETARTYLEALNLKEKGKAHLLDRISDHVISLNVQARSRGIGGIGGNPLVSIHTGVQNAKYFLEKKDIAELTTEILESSHITKQEKDQLINYLMRGD